jgi:putative CocE/NonD family hydrolase
MRDGVRIAVDVHLPQTAHAGRRVPAILHQTRYYRSYAVRKPFQRFGPARLLDRQIGMRAEALRRGYAWLDMCVRGSGASFGMRPCPWSPNEIADAKEILDWIVAQPWSDGTVGATGISYGGASAEHLAGTGHPALKALAPRFALFDVYADVAFPGGIHLSWFTENWGRFNALLDRGDLPGAILHQVETSLEAMGRVPSPLRLRARAIETLTRSKALATVVRAVFAGVRRVDEDPDGAMAYQATLEHLANFDVHATARSATFRDDTGLASGLPAGSIDDFSPHRTWRAIAAAGIPVLSQSGWLDGAYANASIKRFLSIGTPGSELVIGPWNHGGTQVVSPWAPSRKPDFDDTGLVLGFFDRHLRGVEGPAEAPVRYFTIGEERWKTSDSWPPRGFETLTFHLRDDRALSSSGPGGTDGENTYQVSESGTGPRTRWNSLLGGFAPIGYPDRCEQRRQLLCYTSEPLSDDLEVTGHPWLVLWLAIDQPDAAVFGYLADVAPDGSALEVSEGQLRALHRRLGQGEGPYRHPVPWRSFRREDGEPVPPGEIIELAFDFLPLSWRFARGHAIRLVLAGADQDHFASVGTKPATWRVHHGPAHPSRVELPARRG